MGVVAGIYISFNIATLAAITGIDIFATKDSITLISLSRISSPQNSNSTPLNQALVLQSPFLRAQKRWQFNFLELARSLLTEGTNHRLQNYSALMGSKLEANMVTACSMAWLVQCSGLVSSMTSRQCSKLGMILKALGTFPLLYLVNILPIQPQTLLTSGLSMDLSSASLSFFSSSSSHCCWGQCPVSPRRFIRLSSASMGASLVLIG